MPVSKACYAFVLALFLPVVAHADPVTVALQSSTGAFDAGATTTGWFSVNLGDISLSGTNPSGTYLVTGLSAGSDYTATLTLSGISNFDSLRLEVLDPLGDGDDKVDQMEQPSYVPAHYSTSNNSDGLSFAQDSGLDRSAIFVGGSGTVTADENSNRGDILLFSGLKGAEDARITFGLRDRIGGRGFLIRISAAGDPAAPAPEPASMLLVGTGLVGLGTAFRRRRAAPMS